MKVKLVILVFFMIVTDGGLCVTDASVTDEMCISSIVSNSIKYKYSNSTTSEKEVFSFKQLRDVEGMLGLVINVSLLHIDNETDAVQDHHKLYFVTQSSFLQRLDPVVFDSLTFGVLSYTERIRTVSVTLLTASICSDNNLDENQEDQIVYSIVMKSLLNYFHPHSKQSVLVVPAVYKVSFDVRSSAIVLLVSVSVFSLLTVFLVMPVCMKYLTEEFQTNNHENDSTQENSTKLNQNEHVIMVGIYFVSICYAIMYTGYWIIEICDLVLSKGSVLEADKSSFLANCLTVLIMTMVAITTTTAMGLRSRQSFKSRLMIKVFVYMGSSSMIALLTCMVYHSFFLLIALAIDFITTLSELVYLSTLVVTIYCSVPVLLKQFYTTKKMKQYGRLLSFSVLLLMILLFYCLLITSLDPVNVLSDDAEPSHKQYISEAPELVITMLSSGITLLLFGIILMTVFKPNNVVKASIVDESTRKVPLQAPANKDCQMVMRKVPNKPQYKLSSKSIPQLVLIMFSNPGSVITMVQNTTKQPQVGEII